MSSLKFPLSDKEAKGKGIKKNATDNKNALFPTRLRKLREEKGIKQGEKISQQGLADKIGVTKATISLYEMGDNVPDAKTIVKIAEYYHVSTDYLLGLAGDVKTKDIELRRICEITGLSEKAIDNIISITNKIRSTSDIFDKEKVYTQEPKDILNEILTSENLLRLITDIANLTKTYSSLTKITPLYGKLAEDADKEYKYEVWTTNVSVQNLVSDVLERYYLKTKDGCHCKKC